MNLLENYTPDELRFVMIDPKMVQLTPYEGIEHLWRPVIYTPEDAKSTVMALLEEMDRRFDLLADSGVSTIVEYNAQSEEKLPFIILLGTEIADLMMVNGEFYSRAFSLFAMKARAVGIHLYIATQRPSADVITDVLAGHIMGRLVFAVANEVDSVWLLGKPGAEQISEQGRLLFVDDVSGNAQSLKAPYVSDEEVMKIVEQLK